MFSHYCSSLRYLAAAPVMLAAMSLSAMAQEPDAKSSATQPKPATISVFNNATGEYKLFQVQANGERKPVDPAGPPVLNAQPITPAIADYLQAMQAADQGPRCIIGVELKSIPEGLHQRLGIDENCGLIVAELIPDKPAAHAGVQKYDILLKINGAPVSQPVDVVRIINESKTEPVTLTLLRDKEPFDLQVTPIEVQPGSGIPGKPAGEIPRIPPEMITRGLQVVGPGMIVPGARGPDLEVLHADIAELNAKIEKLREQVRHIEETLLKKE